MFSFPGCKKNHLLPRISQISQFFPGISFTLCCPTQYISITLILHWTELNTTAQDRSGLIPFQQRKISVGYLDLNYKYLWKDAVLETNRGNLCFRDHYTWQGQYLAVSTHLTPVRVKLSWIFLPWTKTFQKCGALLYATSGSWSSNKYVQNHLILDGDSKFILEKFCFLFQ